MPKTAVCIPLAFVSLAVRAMSGVLAQVRDPLTAALQGLGSCRCSKIGKMASSPFGAHTATAPAGSEAVA
jgi:hypothetical protein